MSEEQTKKPRQKRSATERIREMAETQGRKVAGLRERASKALGALHDAQMALANAEVELHRLNRAAGLADEAQPNPNDLDVSASSMPVAATPRPQVGTASELPVGRA